MSVYLFISDIAEHAELVEGYGGFTDARPSRPPLSTRQIVLVSFDGEAIGAVGRMSHRSRKAAIYKWHVRLDELELLDDPLPLAEVADAASAETIAALEAARRAPGAQLNGAPAGEVLDVLVRLRPELGPVIQHLRSVSGPVPRRPSAEGEPIVDYERDAIGLALELGGLSGERRSALSAWDGRADEPFLTGIPNYRVLEDRALEHDARVFGDWKAVASGVVGATRFESAGKRVTVINVNRAGVERAIGVDLIYYSQTYDAYVVVQYKRRERSDEDERWAFRPNQQFDAELARMRELVDAETEIAAPFQYRLDPSCAYLKLCAPTTPDAFTDKLVNGVYLPLAYWDVLEHHGAIVGPRGGRVLTDASVGRYFSNSLFIDLVKAGWIGSRAMTSDLIGEIVRSGLDDGRDLILAFASETDGASQALPADGDDELPF